MKRPVWVDNLLSEFTLIQNLVPQFSLVGMDTEFPRVFSWPATVVETPYPKGPDQVYKVLWANVDVLNLIQVVLTLSDADGINLPHHRWDYNYTWEFNFRYFGIHRDLYAPDSVKLLEENGINFEENRLKGICSIQFAELMSSGILFGNNVTWVTFHGAYDFAYLLKIIIRQSLLRTLKGIRGTGQFVFREKCL